MKCIFCSSRDTDVVETRPSEDGSTVRRRRACVTCRKRFTTHERTEQVPLTVIKRDGRRERFSREKLLNGILRSTEKTALLIEQVEAIVSSVEECMKQEETTEVTSTQIGDLVANSLKEVDKVAYIRFASVFRRFIDADDFERELKKLL